MPSFTVPNSWGSPKIQEGWSPAARAASAESRRRRGKGLSDRRSGARAAFDAAGGTRSYQKISTTGLQKGDRIFAHSHIPLFNVSAPAVRARARGFMVVSGKPRQTGMDAFGSGGSTGRRSTDSFNVLRRKTKGYSGSRTSPSGRKY